MGRYAFFNTGFEYKFAFGLQPSLDIVEFGGTGWERYHEWTRDWMPRIKERLEYFEKWLGIETLNFSSYAKNLEGTQELYNTLDETVCKYKGEVQAKYVLGCLIYHQLLYSEKLTASYEL